MKLHLGCGEVYFGPEWVHVDALERPYIKHHSVTDLSFAHGECSLVYASHLLEYFDREEAYEVLREWRRCLRDGGVLRLAVPDFGAMCGLYSSGAKLSRFLGPLYGKIGDPPIYHKTVYDMMSLYKLLSDVGFSSIRRYDWRETEHHHIDDCSQAYIPHMDKDEGDLISLNMEAVK